MPEVLVNDFSDRLAAALTAGATACAVETGVPAALVGSSARARIGTEIVLATFTTATGWALTRAAEDANRYPAAAHPAGTAVDLVLTSAGLAELSGSAAAATGNTLTVDAVHGDDATAAPDRADKPYLTLAAAKAAAASGDLIRVRPGAYTVAASVAADGVGWDLDAGVTITRSGLVLSGIVDDEGAAADFVVSGASDLSVSPSSGTPRAVNVSHADSDVTVKARTITVTSGSGLVMAVSQTAGKLSVEANYIGRPTTGGSPVGVYWENGSLYVRADKIEAVTGQALYMQCNDVPTGEANIHAFEIVGEIPVSLHGSDTTAGVWIRSLTVRCTDPFLNRAIYLGGSSRYYLETQKIFGGLVGLVIGSGGASRTYIRTQKWSAIANGSAGDEQIVRVAAGTHNLILDVQEADPAGFSGGMFGIAAGTTEIRGMRYVANSGSNGIEVTGGTLRLVNCRIDTSANSGTNPIVKTGGTLELVNCTLIAEGTRNAIEASSAQSVAVEGVLTLNRPLHANVTTTGGPVVRTDTGTLTATSFAGTFVAGQEFTAPLTVRNAADTADVLEVRDNGGLVAPSPGLFGTIGPSKDLVRLGSESAGAYTATIRIFTGAGSEQYIQYIGHSVYFGDSFSGMSRVNMADSWWRFREGVVIGWSLGSHVNTPQLALSRPAAGILKVDDPAGATGAAVLLPGRADVADGELAAGQMALWFESTAGAAKLRIKAKDAGGTVRTGEVALT